MNNTELIREFASKGHLTLKDSRELIKVLEEIVLSHAREEGGVKLFSSGLTIGAKYQDARTGRNPATGESIEISASYKPVAKFGKVFKETINA